MTETLSDDESAMIRKFCVDLVVAQVSGCEIAEFVGVLVCAQMVETYITTGEIPRHTTDRNGEIRIATAH